MSPFEECKDLYDQYFEVCPQPDLFKEILDNIQSFVELDPLQRFSEKDLPQLCKNYLIASINVWTQGYTPFEELEISPDEDL